ncbi:MAG: hypothetical protein ACRCRT_02340 [Cetobacterium somerae]
MRLRGEIKDLEQAEYLELFDRYVNRGGVSMRHIEILADEDLFIFVQPNGSKEIIEINDYVSMFTAVEKCIYYEWI